MTAFESQSLIHQVSVSDLLYVLLWQDLRICLNPLFIRSQFQIVNRERIVCDSAESQSLIHQVSVSDGDIVSVCDGVLERSQSLIHQVSVSDLQITVYEQV